MLFTIIICVLAGLGSGLGTGFAGLSAAVFISPMLVTFLDVPIYDAVGISLASDVLASAVSAYVYGRQGNIELRRGKTLLLSVLVSAVIGSLIAFVISSHHAGAAALGYWAIIATTLLGVKFLVAPETKRGDESAGERRRLAVLGFGVYIGLVCGFQGTGGGMMLLFVLTSVMRFPFKSAVGTSVFIMSFTALIGAAAHFWMNGMPDTLTLLVCIASTTVFARVGAAIANKMKERTLGYVTGTLLTVSGGVMLVFKLLG